MKAFVYGILAHQFFGQRDQNVLLKGRKTGVHIIPYMGSLRENVPKVLSSCHTTCPSFFWYDTDFLYIYIFFFKRFFFLKSRCHTIPHHHTLPSFFWNDNGSEHQGPFRLTQPSHDLLIDVNPGCNARQHPQLIYCFGIVIQVFLIPTVQTVLLSDRQSA